MRIGCEAKFGGCLNEYRKWVIRNSAFEHNHGVSPAKAKYFPCNRHISSSVKKCLDINDKEGIRVAQNFTSVVVETKFHFCCC